MRESNMEMGREHVEGLDETLAKLPADVRMLLPDANLDYYRTTSEMHCDTSKPGGSKFLDVPNILKVLERDGGRIADMVKKRQDDRQTFLDAGVDAQVFLPATKNPGDPEGLPEALYYRVEGFKGKLGIIQLQELDPEIPVLVHREKSAKDEQGKEKVPCSFSITRMTLEDMPDSDFATVIIGREGGEQGKDELWTIHPGAPVRVAQGDFLPGSESLPGPQEGKKQKVMVVKVKDLLATSKMTERDYVKILPGKWEDVVAQYEVSGKESESERPKLSRERLADMQTLEVEIEADFESVLRMVNEATGANLQPRPDRFHLTIIGPAENKILGTLDDETLAELQRINAQIQGGEGITVKGVGFIDGASAQYQMRAVDRTKKAAFIALDIPTLQAFRSKAGLPQKDFHVTLGFEGGDIHTQIVGQEPVKPGSPKMKDITAPIPKQADPRFGTIPLPQIRYGGLDGQMKQRK